jgi:hypothetical protein
MHVTLSLNGPMAMVNTEHRRTMRQGPPFCTQQSGYDVGCVIVGIWTCCTWSSG